jgi:hypothetical protein
MRRAWVGDRLHHPRTQDPHQHPGELTGFLVSRTYPKAKPLRRRPYRRYRVKRVR